MTTKQPDEQAAAREAQIGDFIFRPPVTADKRIEDELLFDAGKYFVHLEYMSTQGIWIGISDNEDYHKMLHLDFFIGDKKVKDEEGKMVYPLLLGVRGISCFTQAAAEQRSEQPAAEVIKTVFTCEHGKTACPYCAEIIAGLRPAEPLGDVCERYQGGLGNKAMQRAWMRYADEQDVPHDHEDEEPFKYGFDAGINSKPAPNPQAVEADVDLRTTLAYEAGQQAGREECLKVMRQMAVSANPAAILHQFSEKLRGEQNAK